MALTPEQLKEARQIFAVENAKKGGKRRAELLSPERRSDIAREAVLARWAKTRRKRKKKKATKKQVQKQQQEPAEVEQPAAPKQIKLTIPMPEKK